MFDVSLIIPVYNTPVELLNRAICSADSQQASKEVIVVDDGSERKLSFAYEAVVDKYPNARLIKKKNGGVSSARNVGLKAACGKWVGFLDADDILADSYLIEALEILRRTDADAVHGGYWYEYMSGARSYYGQPDLAPGEYRLLLNKEIEYLKGSLFDRSSLEKIGLSGIGYCSSCCSLFRREWAVEVCFDESLVISEDRLFNYMYWELSSRIALAGGCWYRYMENGASASHSLRLNAKAELLNTATAFESLLENASPLIRKAIWVGIVECYQQTLWFTILHPGFTRAFGMSAHSFVRALMDERLYIQAFSSISPSGFKEKLQKTLFERRFALLTSACFKLNGALFDLKTWLRQGCEKC